MAAIERVDSTLDKQTGHVAIAPTVALSFADTEVLKVLAPKRTDGHPADDKAPQVVHLRDLQQAKRQTLLGMLFKIKLFRKDRGGIGSPHKRHHGAHKT